MLSRLLRCASVNLTATAATSHVEDQPFGETAGGTAVELFTLRNRQGVEVKITNYGGIVTSFIAPDGNGKMGDVVLGYDNLAGYLHSSPYFGALIGRCANRIAKGKFTLDRQEHSLAINNGPNALHGGIKGFDKVVWTPKVVRTPDGAALELTYLSKDGEEGYPGNLCVKAVYTLMEDSGLRLEYTATSDKPTIVNLSQHSYFNLAGKGDVLGHEVMIKADAFTPIDNTLIPTGELRPVEGTPFDFRQPMRIGARINNDDEQLKFGKGYDHNWVLAKPKGKLDLAASVYDPVSGRVLEVFTSEPGMQFYTGNFLNGSITGKGGWTYQFRNGFCLEPQHFPDSPNHPEFPSTVLRPGEEYHHTIIYRVGVRK
jgi:aldose 1-epimerase